MDRKTWLAVGLSLLGLVLWQWYYQSTYGPYLREQEKLKEQAKREAAASPTPAPAAAAAPTATPSPVATPERTGPVIAARNELLNAEGRAEFLFSNDTGGISTAILLDHLGAREGPVSLNANREMPIGAIGERPGSVLGGFEMLADQSKGVVTFTRQDADGLTIEKKFSLPAADSPEAPYVVNLEITFRNATAKPLSRAGYSLSTGGAAPIHESDLPTYTRYDWYRDGKMKSIDVNWFNAGQIPLIGIQTRPARAEFTEAADSVTWAAVSSQYFCTILTAESTPGNSVWATRFVEPNGNGSTIHGMQGALGLPGFEIAPGQSVVQKFQIYAGPKDLTALHKLRGNQESVMNFGMFGFVSKFLLWAMNLLHGLLGSYAAAIIVLTLCIKTGLWPLQNKATDSMKRMALLSPKMTELREKYKNDPTKMNEELMKLYREYSVNPFSGCLPMLIQIPIFFGFYSMLGSAIELRNSSFLWVQDLSQPDTIGHIAGFPINILPLFMAGTMVWQMVISPKSGDAAQQRMMILMPVIFVVFAYNYASALSLYWTTQNLFSIVQLYLTRNKPLPVLEKKSDIEKRETAAMKRKKKKRSLP